MQLPVLRHGAAMGVTVFSKQMKANSTVPLWSATPTPLGRDFKVDADSVERMVQAAVHDGLNGLFLAGTCGEGAWMTNRERSRLAQLVVRFARGRLKVAVQVSDFSVPRITENALEAAQAGADYAIIAPPPMMINDTPERITALYVEAIAASPLPVGIYDLGAHRSVAIPQDRLQEIYLQPGVKLVKDSSGDPARRAMALAARAAKPELQLLNGDEFRCIEYLEAGYDGFMFGGAAAVAPFMTRIAALFQAGRIDEAKAADAEMTTFLYGIYGGPEYACWLTGLKYYLVQSGVFSTTTSFFGYPLTPDCRAYIDQRVRTRTM